MRQHWDAPALFIRPRRCCKNVKAADTSRRAAVDNKRSSLQARMRTRSLYQHVRSKHVRRSCINIMRANDLTVLVEATAGPDVCVRKKWYNYTFDATTHKTSAP